MDGITDAAHVQIDRRQNLVAAPIIRMLRKMCFDLGDRDGHIHGGGRSVEPRRERCIGQIRMADRRIKGNRDRRDKNQYGKGDKRRSLAMRLALGSTAGFRRRHQAARRFRLGALGIFRRHQTLRFVPLNFGELGFVQRDANFAAPNPARRSCKRPKDADHRGGGE